MQHHHHHLWLLFFFGCCVTRGEPRLETAGPCPFASLRSLRPVAVRFLRCCCVSIVASMVAYLWYAVQWPRTTLDTKGRQAESQVVRRRSEKAATAALLTWHMS